MKLHGQLQHFPLDELFNLCIDTLVGGNLVVGAPLGEHTLFFQQGVLYHAMGPDAVGFAAVWPLFSLDDAPYQFTIAVPAPGWENERTITDATPLVLHRAQLLAARWRRMRPYISGPSDVPALLTPPSGAQVQINEEDWPVLGCIDGQQTIADIARTTVTDEITVCKSLLRLRRRGLVHLGPPRPRVAAPKPQGEQPAPANDQQGVAPKDGLFAATLATLPLDLLTPPDALPAVPEPTRQPDDPIVQLLRTV